MRALVQRVSEAQVLVDSTVIASIAHGLLAFIGLCRGDSEADIRYIVDKSLNLRIFPNIAASTASPDAAFPKITSSVASRTSTTSNTSASAMNYSLMDTGGELLLVSQFTLYADTRKGRRPSFNRALPATEARELYSLCVEEFKQSYGRVQSGIFQAHMRVALVNDGPVTLMLDSAPSAQYSP